MTTLLLAIVFSIATKLQGEAGVISTPAMYAVADTMLFRHQQYTDQGYSYERAWEKTLSAYYAYAEPSEEALAIARQMIERPWTPMLNSAFAFSNEDAYNQGWAEHIDYKFCNFGLCVNIADSIGDY